MLKQFFKKPKALCLLICLIAFLSLFIMPAWSADTSPDARQLLQLAEYIGVDYPEAVKNGAVINPGEYQEMQDFARLILSQSHALTPQNSELLQAAQHLSSAIEAKKEPTTIQKLTTNLRQILLTLAPQLSLPSNLQPLPDTVNLFQQHCVACHGQFGQGNGELAPSLEPPPTNFTDRERARHRSIIGLYDAISQGLEGTAMTAFEQLNTQQRWSLAFYVGSLAFIDKPKSHSISTELPLEAFVTLSPNTLVQKYPDHGMAKIEQLRAQPNILFQPLTDPLQLTVSRLKEVEDAYRHHDYKAAQRLAVSAYLDGFELVENTLNTRDPDLTKRIEKKMLALRQQIAEKSQAEQMTIAIKSLQQDLAQAQALLQAKTLSGATLFSASLVILLREGLEALLVVLALTTILIRAQRNDALRFVHLGWISALIAGVFTWWCAQYLIHISGASREIMEGVAALLAAFVLFYVGFWMHSKVQADQWQNFIKNKIQKHLGQGTLWGIASLAFISVYREVFETVLFYQSLLTQSTPQQYIYVGGGFFGGVAILALLTWLMIHFSVKLPLGKFFALSTYLMLGLSFILTGKGISALQEAAIISISPFPLQLSVDWLGIHATWEGFISQLIVLILSLILISGFTLMRSSESKPSLDTGKH